MADSPPTRSFTEKARWGREQEAAASHQAAVIAKNLRKEQDAVRNRILGVDGTKPVIPTQVLKDRRAARERVEHTHVVERKEILQAELEDERKQRHRAEARVAQLEAELENLKQQKKRHILSRVEAEERRNKEKDKRIRLADAKRHTESEHQRLLKVHRKLRAKYEDLVQQVAMEKELRDAASFFKGKTAREYFFGEGGVFRWRRRRPLEDGDDYGDAEDNTSAPVAFRDSPRKRPSRMFQKKRVGEGGVDDTHGYGSEKQRVEAECNECGELGQCVGWKPNSFNPNLCECGHPKRSHNFEVFESEEDNDAALDAEFFD